MRRARGHLERVSILWHLRKFIDIIAFERQEAALRRQREAWPADVDPKSVDFGPPAPRPEPETVLTCRICGRSGEDEWCPDCLAPTREPRAQPEPEAGGRKP